MIIPDGTYTSEGPDVTPYSQISVSTVVMVERAGDGSGTFLFYDRRSGGLSRVPGLQQVPDMDPVDLTKRAWRGVLKDDRLYVAVDGVDGGATVAQITADGRVTFPLSDTYLGNDLELGVDVCNGDLVAWSATVVGNVTNRELFRFTMNGGLPTGIDDSSRTWRSTERDGYRFQRGIVRACGDRWLARADSVGGGAFGSFGGEIATSGPLATNEDVAFGNATAYELGWNGTWASISVYKASGVEYWEDEKSALFNTDTGESYVVAGAADGCSGISQSGDWIAWEETVGPPSPQVLARPRATCVTYVGRLALTN